MLLGMFFHPSSEGTWWLKSKSDPRWDVTGYGPVGGFVMPDEAVQAKKKLEKKYGPPPEDLEFGYMKD